MSNLLRILLFVPPMFLLVFPAYSQLNGTIEQNTTNGTYTVSVVPSVNWAPPTSITTGAILTVRAATGKLQVIDFQSLTGTWITSGVFVAPNEATGYDYFSFATSGPPISNITYNSGVKIPLFSFRNSLGCAQVELIDNLTDPLNVEPNSMSVSIENYMTVVGAGPGINAYAGNNAQSFTECPPVALFITSNLNPVLCNGDVTDINLTVTGGQEPYTITWVNNSSGETGTVPVSTNGGSGIMAGMPAGNYSFTITDDLDSIAQTTYQLVQPQPLTIEMLGLNASCTGSQDGEVQVERTKGGTFPYHYDWAGFPTETDSIISAIGVGEYNVTVTDNNGCIAIGSASVNPTGEVVLSNTTLKNISCNGANDGLIDLFPISPTLNNNWDFQWSSNVTTVNESAAYNLGPGSYSVTVTDVDAGCVKIETFTVSEPPAIEVDYRLTEPKCYGEQGLLEIIGISNVNLPWSAEITGGESVKDGDKFLLEPGFPMRLVVEDAKGCTSEEDFIVAARQELQLEVGESQDIKYGQQVEIDAQHYPFENVTFQWSPSDGLSCSDCPNPIAKPTDGMTYRLVMSDSAGCVIDDFINISVRKSRDIFIPNSFSPNQDGINDSFHPYGGFEIVSIHSMAVYDRWGNKMFQSPERFMANDAEAGWKGTARNKFADPGLYLYTMNVEFIDGEVVLFTGEVNLMK